ncbi:hypothetical protein ACIBO1_06235 [Micromonospora sp. NPDC049903]|uniref:hypothetical protein n=1 Tax=Micromonospora sp. NPDC049903 TaxID=3364276 RepID=UPI00379AF51B
MTQPKTDRIPAPLYAAAGAGDLALKQLRRLPTVVGELRDRVTADGGRVVSDLGGKAVVAGFELRQKANDALRNANQTAESLRQKATPADLNRLREAADLNRLREVADLNRLREAADPAKLREAADVQKLREAADLDRLRELATRNAAVVVAGAHAAQERALAAYGALVAHGERVVGAGVVEAAETVNADIDATEATVEPTAIAPDAAPVTRRKKAEAPSPAEVAEIVEAKPAAKKAAARKTTAAKVSTRQPAAAKKATPSAKLPRATKRTRPASE